MRRTHASGGDIFANKDDGAVMADRQPIIRVQWEDWADIAVGLPDYATQGAAGADIRANLAANQRKSGIMLDPMQRVLIPTGLRLQVALGHEVQIRPRSGLALQHGVTLVNAPGTIDSDYRGPIGVLLINLGAAPFHVAHGDRIAQLVVAPVAQARFEVVDKLTETPRAAGGFGSTGRC